MNFKVSNTVFIYIAFFLMFGGYYAFLVVQANSQIPFKLANLTRVMILFSVMGYFFTAFKVPRSFTFNLVLVFLLMYLARLLFDIVFTDKDYWNYLVYFLTFSLLPFCFISFSNVRLVNVQSIVNFIQLGFLFFFVFLAKKANLKYVRI